MRVKFEMKIGYLLIKSFIVLSIIILSTVSVNAEPVTTRLGGTTRYSTAVQIARHGWTSSDYVILASGLNYPDALCSASLSKIYDAPVLLTGSDSLNSDASAEIKLLGAKNVFILGGVQSISLNVENELVKSGLTITRLYDTDRYSTSVKIAKQLGDVSEVIVVNGDSFSDALSVAPVAGMKAIPILLVSSSSVSKSVLDYIKTQNITKTYVIGGQSSVSDEVMSKFTNTERIYGKDKYDTDIAIINKFKNLFDLKSFITASSSDFPDSLGGIALAAKISSPIVLLSNSDNTKMRTMLKGTTLTTNIVLGGSGATPDSRVKELFVAPIIKPVVRDVNSLVYGSTIMATVNYKANGLVKDQKVQIILDHGNGTSYEVYSASGKYITVNASALSIPKDPVTNTDKLSSREIETYANTHSFVSKTGYYVWVDIARQQVYVLTGSKSKWVLNKAFGCLSGHNITPTVRGKFEIGAKQYLVSGVGYYGRCFYPQYYFHSNPMYVDGSYDKMGAPASHGCIRLSFENAKWLYTTIPNGTCLWVY